MQKEETKQKSNRELVSDILAAVHPEADLADEEVVFGIIYNDYEEYAQMIENREADLRRAEEAAELRGRNMQIEESLQPKQIGDGVPTLGGANIPTGTRQTSIFDIAGWE